MKVLTYQEYYDKLTEIYGADNIWGRDDESINVACPICNGYRDLDIIFQEDGTIHYSCYSECSDETTLKAKLKNLLGDDVDIDKWDNRGIKREQKEEPIYLPEDIEEEIENKSEENVKSDENNKSKKNKRIKKVTEFEDIDHEYLWDPYLPIGNFTVLMASGGTGKSILTCGIAAAITTGTKLYGMQEAPKPKNVLFISAEDSGEDYRGRLRASGADLERVFVVDKDDSIGLLYESDDFEEIIKETEPALVIVDPWHAFAGDIDINRINIVRPLYQKLDRLAAKYHCAMLLVSHVNKKTQDGNANNAAVGSVDFINASRSALQVIFDMEDESQRIMVHTKINHRKFGKSLKYRIIKDGGIEWTGTSEITRFTLEEAAGKHKKPQEIVNDAQVQLFRKVALIEAINDLFSKTDKTEINVSYQQFKDDYGDDIFGGRSRPMKCFEEIEADLFNNHISFKDANVGYKGKTYNGIKFMKTKTTYEAMTLSDTTSEIISMAG